MWKRFSRDVLHLSQKASSSFSEVQELADKGRLHTPDTGIILLVRLPPPPCARHTAPGGSYGLFSEGRAYSYFGAAAHAPLGHAGLPCYGFLLPRNRARPTDGPTFLLGDRYEHPHPVGVTQLLEVLSTENVAEDGPVAHHHVAFARRARHHR